MRGQALLLAAVVICCVAGAPAVVAAAPAPPPAWVIAQLGKAYAGLRDYQVGALVDVAFPGIEMPDMAVTAYFRAPDKTAIRSRGFALVPEQGVFLLPTVFGPERFVPLSCSVVGSGGSRRFHVVLKPKPGMLGRMAGASHIHPLADSADTNIPDVPVEIWVDPATWTITRIQAQVSRGTGMTGMSFQAVTRYALQSGYRLPKRTTITMTLPDGLPDYNPRRPGSPRDGSDMAPHSSGPVRGTITLNFYQYTVNKGVADAVFRKPRR